VLNHIQDNVDGISIYTENQNSEQDNNYYKGIQFKLLVGIKGSEYEIVDGGFVDWSQKLLGNKKERMLISGMGVDFLLALMK